MQFTFWNECREQIREIGEVGFDPIIVAPFDAELFGHWWFEGPIVPGTIHSPRR